MRGAGGGGDEGRQRSGRAVVRPSRGRARARRGGGAPEAKNYPRAHLGSDVLQALVHEVLLALLVGPDAGDEVAEGLLPQTLRGGRQRARGGGLGGCRAHGGGPHGDRTIPRSVDEAPPGPGIGAPPIRAGEAERGRGAGPRTRARERFRPSGARNGGRVGGVASAPGARADLTPARRRTNLAGRGLPSEQAAGKKAGRAPRANAIYSQRTHELRRAERDSFPPSPPPRGAPTLAPRDVGRSGLARRDTRVLSRSRLLSELAQIGERCAEAMEARARARRSGCTGAPSSARPPARRAPRW